MIMRKLAIAAAAVAAISTAAVTPADARWRGGPGLAFGLAAGALTLGAIAASRPYYYDYGYYPGYYGGPYAYYGGPVIYSGPRYYRWHRWHHHHHHW
jgi:hypothetical protein